MEKNFTGDSGGIRTHDLLHTSADVLTSRPLSLLDDDRPARILCSSGFCDIYRLKKLLFEKSVIFSHKFLPLSNPWFTQIHEMARIGYRPDMASGSFQLWILKLFRWKTPPPPLQTLSYGLHAFIAHSVRLHGPHIVQLPMTYALHDLSSDLCSAWPILWPMLWPALISLSLTHRQ